jgi:Arc/MetJ family transcription regulator
MLTHRGFSPVRTNIEIDDQLLSAAMRSSGARTKKTAVEAGLRLLVKTQSQAAIHRLRGKVQWEGDLNESRPGRYQG